MTKRGNIIQLKCPKCGKCIEMLESVYKVRSKHQKNFFCSRECYKKYSCIKPKQCKQCNKIFLPKDTRVQFCCKQCCFDFVRNTGIKKHNGFWYENGYKVLYNNGNSIKEHIYIMEQHIGRKLLPNEVVHHIDKDKTNNNISNLLLLTQSEHSKLHRELDKKSGKKFFGRT